MFRGELLNFQGVGECEPTIANLIDPNIQREAPLRRVPRKTFPPQSFRARFFFLRQGNRPVYRRSFFYREMT